jgi:hypothetical protein
MFKALRQIGAADWVVVVTGLAVVVALEFLPESVAPQDQIRPEMPAVTPVPPVPVVPDVTPTIYARPSELRYLRDQTVPHKAKPPLMGEEARKAINTRFRKNSAYFGAFALSANSAAYGWSEGYSSPASADAAAIARCHSFGPDCKVIARLSPLNLVGDPAQPSLSYLQGRAYQALAAAQGPRAFAYAENGQWAEARATDPAQAAAAALAACGARAGAGKPPTQTPCMLLALWPD